MKKKRSVSCEASKTIESCLLFNKSEDYTILCGIILVSIIYLINIRQCKLHI